MANNIEYASILQNKLDQRAVEQALTGWMEANAKQAIYNGGKEIKIPRIETDGLADYDRGNGYPEGSVTLDFETKTMTQDRGRSFLLDAMDVNESNFIVNAGAVVGDFQRRQVVPEIDAYRLSITAQNAGHNRVSKPNTKDVLQLLNDDIATILNVLGSGTQLMIHISQLVYSLLNSNETLSRQLNVADFKRGEISTKIKAIDEHLLIPTPSGRMKSKYVFYKGKEDASTGEGDAAMVTDRKAGGFAPGADARDMNWVIIPVTTPIAVSKTDKMKIISPEVYQKADGWFLGYRKYHDLWVAENKKEGIFVNYAS